MKNRKELRLLAGILVLGILIRIVMVFVLHLPHMHKDSYEYYRQAAILEQGSYLNYFPNGYPFVILIAQMVSMDHSQAILLCLNIVMSTITIWWVWDIAKRVFRDDGVALTAAFLMAIFPPLINYVRWIMTETPTVFYLVGACHGDAGQYRPDLYPVGPAGTDRPEEAELPATAGCACPRAHCMLLLLWEDG